VIALWRGHALCLFRAVTKGVMSPQYLSESLGNLAEISLRSTAGIA
jgi:hypothetical protein